jgi:hypothetical protein
MCDKKFARQVSDFVSSIWYLNLIRLLDRFQNPIGLISYASLNLGNKSNANGLKL